MSLRLVSGLPPLFWIVLACILAAIAWWVYWRETRQAISSPLSWTLPTLRALAIAIVTLTLAEPVLESEKREGEPGRIMVLLDHSESMSLDDRTTEDEATSSDRLQRARSLIGLQPRSSDANVEEISAGLVEALSDRFDVSIHKCIDGTTLPLWDSRTEVAKDAMSGAAMPDTASTNKANDRDFSRTSCLGEWLDWAGVSSSESTTRPVVVLLSDGQSNDGKSPIEAAESLTSKGIAVFTIGLGASETLDDLAIKDVKLPNRAYFDDSLAGSISIEERLEATNYQIEIRFLNELVWSKELTAKRSENRKVDYDFPVKEIVTIAQKELGSEIEISQLPAKLEFKIVCGSDRIAANNVRSAFTSITTQKAKLLLIDGRSRWETRYLKNMFTRDPAWDLVCYIAKPNPIGGYRLEPSSRASIPATETELFEYNLIILGDVPGKVLGEPFQKLLVRFVETRGGGLIVVDGARGHLESQHNESLHELFPVRWNAQVTSLEAKPRLTETGRGLEVMRLDELGSVNTSSDSGWNSLPPLQYVRSVRVRSGAEVILEAKSDISTEPLFVTQRFGAGRVLYSATDETWRWRYRVADKIHTRLWNQLARWTMAPPFSVNNEFVSLDAGKPQYEVGERIEIRSRLRDSRGEPYTNQSVTAILEDDAGREFRLRLDPDDQIPGDYSSSTQGLEPSSYGVQLEVSGIPNSALQVRTNFSVSAPQSIELSATTCNEELLKTIASTTGGDYFHESDISGLVQRLRPLSGGSISLRTTVVWDSYWWFSAGMLLLVIEWILRKRSGLV